jgi:hypothetical protein
MLLNLARVYELADQNAQAIFALETYLERDPQSPRRAQIARRIEGLRAKTEQASPQSEAQPEPDTPPPDTAVPPPPVQTEPPPTQPAEPSTGRSIVPLIVAGAGGVLFIVGGIVYLDAASEVQEWEDRCPDRVCTGNFDPEDANAARTRQDVGGALSITGLVIGGAGLVWYFTQSGGESQQARARSLPPVTATVGRGYTGLQFSGTF